MTAPRSYAGTLEYVTPRSGTISGATGWTGSDSSTAIQPGSAWPSSDTTVGLHSLKWTVPHMVVGDVHTSIPDTIPSTYNLNNASN